MTNSPATLAVTVADPHQHQEEDEQREDETRDCVDHSWGEWDGYLCQTWHDDHWSQWPGSGVSGRSGLWCSTERVCHHPPLLPPVSPHQWVVATMTISRVHTTLCLGVVSSPPHTSPFVLIPIIGFFQPNHEYSRVKKEFEQSQNVNEFVQFLSSQHISIISYPNCTAN